MLVKYCHQQVRAVPLLSKISSFKEKRVVPLDNQRYRYLRFRAIGNLEIPGFNGNWDGFPYREFENTEPGFGYTSFRGKNAHLEHNSALREKGSIGDLPDSFLNKFVLPEGIERWRDLDGNENTAKRIDILKQPNQTDGSIEVLMRIDLEKSKDSNTDPKVREGIKNIVKAIDLGQNLTCSMGTNCSSSVCSCCGNEAVYSADYCDHLKKRKGSLHIVTANEIRDMLDKDILRAEWLKHIIASTFDETEVLNGYSNKGIAVKAGEINLGLSFFELSVVKVPAYTDAIALENFSKVASGNREQYLHDLRKKIGDENIINLYEMVSQGGASFSFQQNFKEL